MHRLLAFFSVLLTASSCLGAISVHVVETDAGVQFAGSGSINVLGGTFVPIPDSGGLPGLVWPGLSLQMSPDSSSKVDTYTFTEAEGPSRIGPQASGGGPMTFATSGSGDAFAVGFGEIDEAFFSIAVPMGYVSDSPLMSEMFFEGHTFATLGITAGEYLWSFGTGENADTFSLNVIPEPSIATLLLTYCTLPVLVRRRR